MNKGVKKKHYVWM